MSALPTIPLLPHATDHPPAGLVLRAGAQLLEDGTLHLSWRIDGPLEALRLPPPASPAAADGLWRHTCAEAFVATPGALAYREFNFSPDGRWAVYDFDDYRARSHRAPPVWQPRIGFERGAQAVVVAVAVPAALLPTAPWHVGLAMVIEAADGSVSHWAATHPCARPDFHHRDGFALTLAEDSPA